MKELHRKRENHHNTIRSQFIQQYFCNRRKQLVHQLHNDGPISGQQIMPDNLQGSQKQFMQQIKNRQKIDFSSLNKLLICKPRLDKQLQETIYQEFANTQNLNYQKLTTLSLLINRSDFKINNLVYNNKASWSSFIKRILSKIDQEINQKNHIQHTHQNLSRIDVNSQQCNILTSQIANKLFAWILLLIWKIKPQFQLFMLLPKYYLKLLNISQNKFGLALIAQLSYEKNLLPSESVIKIIMQDNVSNQQSSEAFCTIEILKNYLSQMTPQNFTIHFKQCIFDYMNWLKKQFSRIVSTHEEQQVDLQIKHYLIYLLNCVLNKLQQYNQHLRGQITVTQILTINQEIFGQSQNHSCLYFLIETLKQSKNGAFFQLIEKTLIIFLSLVHISKGQNAVQFSQILQIQDALDKTRQNKQQRW